MALSRISGTTGIVDGSITSAKLADFSAAVDLNGVELILDADADTSISADTDDQIDIKIANADHLKILSSSGDTVLKPMVDAKDIIFQQFDGNKVFEINDGNFVSVGGNATAAGQIRIYEDTDNGSHYSGFTVGNLTASVAYQLPNADGSSGQQLTTDGSGVLSWAVAGTNPPSADGDSLGTASLEWSDLFLADGGTIQFGNDQEVTLTHVHDTGLLLSATDQLQFGDSGTYIHQSADGVLDLVSDTEIEINATTIDVNGNLDVSGTLAQAGVATFTARDIHSGGITIANAGQIGSVGDADAIAIASDGVVTMTQIPVFSAGLNVSGGTIAGTLSTAAQGNITSLGTLTTLTVDDITINASTISDGSHLTLDAGGDIILDSDAANWRFKDDGTSILEIASVSSGPAFFSAVSDADMLFKGNDGGAAITALTIDMSAAGAATFNSTVTATGFTIGSAVINETELEILDGATLSTTELNYVDGVTSSIQTQLDAKLPLAGGTMTGTLKLNDNVVIYLGTGDDLQLKHDGSNSFVRDVGAGNLIIEGENNIIVRSVTGSEKYIEAVLDGGVDLYHNNVKKFETTSTGISVTGTGTFTTADNTDTLSLVSTDADANSGPNLRLYRNSSSPADDDVAGSIVFSGEDDAGNETDYASIKVITEDVTNGSEDGRLSFNILDGGNAVEVMSIFDNFVGIGTIAPEQLLHVHANDSGSTYSADGADRFILENNDSLRIDLRTPATSTVGIMFSDTTRNVGSINYSHSNNDMNLIVNSNSNFGFRIDPSNILSSNAEAAPDTGIGGITLNQGASDEMIMSFKSSDIAQPMTSVKQADTYGFIEKKAGATGGIKMGGLTDNADGHAFEVVGFQASENTAEATSASSAVCVNAFKRDGSSNAAEALPAGGNVFGVKNGDDMQCLFKGDGEIHTNTTGTSNAGNVSTFDGYDDAQLVRAYDLSKGHYARGLIDSQFDKFVKYNTQDLVDANIIGTDDKGNATSFVNITGLQRLHNGAIWQQYEKTQRLTQAMYKLATKTLGKEEADKLLDEEEIKLLN